MELKNRPTMWHKARKVSLTAGQTEIKIEFPLPIVACNLMIEYADFYENIQASSETLQCPRCSASVPANPGVCSNCGENVFQCHKCRWVRHQSWTMQCILKPLENILEFLEYIPGWKTGHTNRMLFRDDSIFPLQSPTFVRSRSFYWINVPNWLFS